MKDLGKTIDRILKIEPDLDTQLNPIKKRFHRYPHKAMDYWKQLIDILNSDDMMEHPGREKIRKIVTSRRKRSTSYNTFDQISTNDLVVAAIPENISDRIKRHDKQSIDLAKKQVEANLTRNMDLQTDLLRKSAKLDILLKKIWIDLKDYFELWDKSGVFTIKKDGALLVLVQENENRRPQNNNTINVVGMDQQTFYNFLRHMGLDPPE